MLWLFLLFFSDQFDSAYRAGLAALNSNDLVAAESRLVSASKLEPRNARVWLALAQTYWKQRKPQASLTAARKAETFTKDPVILHGLAFFYSEATDYGKAAALEARYAVSTPDAYPAAVELYLRAGTPKPAIEAARKGLAARDRADLHNLLGKAYEEDGDPVKAAAEFQAAIDRNRFDESYYFDLAQLQLKQQAFAAALQTLDTGRKHFDKSAQLELASGVAYYGLRRFPEAINAFLQTIRLNPGLERPYLFLARMLEQAEDKRPQILEVSAAFAKGAPGNYVGTFVYGKALELENPAEAAALFRQSIASNGKFWESHFELASLLEQAGKFEDAAAEMQQAIELNPQDPTPHYRLARIYDRLGKPGEARAERELHSKLSASGAVIK